MTEVAPTVKALLENLERALRQRNPILADRLEPGLPENRIRRMLRREKVEGQVEPILALFAWKNGSRLDPSVVRYASPFPDSEYIFLDLEMMIAHFRGFDECAVHHPRYAKVMDRYFPAFWDGSENYLVVDLHAGKNNAVARINTDLEEMVQPAYASFEELLKDAIRANEQNDKLTCFQ